MSEIFFFFVLSLKHTTYTHFTVNHTHHKHHSGEQNIMPAPYQDGARSGAVGGATVLKAGRSRARFLMVSLEFFFDIILLALGGLSL